MKFKLATVLKSRVSKVQVSRFSKNQQLAVKVSNVSKLKVSRATVRQKVSNSRVKLEVRLTFF